MTPDATQQGVTKFGREHQRHLSVCIATAGEELDELLRGKIPFHKEGEKTAELATEFAGQALHLSLVIFPSGAVGFRKAWIQCTSGTMPYESKYYAFEEQGLRRIDS